MEPPAPHPTRKLALENERLRLRIEALERLAAESREAEEARREDEARRHRGADERRRHETDVLARITSEINASLSLDTILASSRQDRQTTRRPRRRAVSRSIRLKPER